LSLTLETNVMSEASKAEVRECAKCRGLLEKGDAYYCMRLGMDEEPSHVEASEPLVEDLHELCFCGPCEPGMRLLFEGFLGELWSARASDAPLLGTDLGRETPTPADIGDMCEMGSDGDDEPPTLPGLAQHERHQ
jgi:hypothetical protein